MSRTGNIILFTILFIATIFCGAISILMGMYMNEAAHAVLKTTDENVINNFAAILNSIFIAGGSLGGFLIGITGDAIGRKKATILSVAFLGLFTLLIAYTTNEFTIYLFRFLSGTGVGGILVISFTYLDEVWPKKTLAVYAGILSIAFPVGIFSAGTIKYFVNNWQQAFLVGAIPLAIAAIGFWVLQESKDWASNTTDKPVFFNKQLFNTQHRKSLLTGAALFGSMLIGLWAIFLWLPSWIQQISMATVADKNTGLSVMLLGSGGLLGGFCSGWIVNYTGAKRSLITCFLACCIFSLLLFLTNSKTSALLFVEIGLLGIFFGISQGVLSAYIPQLFPVHIKAAATGFCFNAGRILTAVAILFVGLLVNTFGGYANALLVFSSVFVIGLLILLFTKQKV